VRIGLQIAFLLGPAGSGKTFRCLAAIRRELLARPEGKPLILLAPKQATFQLERQLLAEGELAGSTRLRVFSFERLARFVFEALKAPMPEVLSEQGRVMVLRAILGEAAPGLAVFQKAARRLGFAEELSAQIREFQNHGLNPAAVRRLAAQVSGEGRVAEKIGDLVELFERYERWLEGHGLRDGDALLDLAADRLEQTAEEAFALGGLWLDGFAQLTPQERRLLQLLPRFSPASTLAFCLESEEAPRSVLSQWSLVRHTFARCRAELETRYGAGVIRVERLARDGARGRFANSPALRRLERCWGGRGVEAAEHGAIGDFSGVEIRACADPEAEAVLCAREIVMFARGGGRYREATVLLRDFNGEHPHALRSVFQRYGIPFFLDHRAGAAHHPLAELTRGALRTLAFHWRHRDWFGALKSGLALAEEGELDALENEALARGWSGEGWRNGFKLPENSALEKRLNAQRERIIAPFLDLERALGVRPAGRTLAAGLRKLWRAVRAEEQLAEWSEDPAQAKHSTVFEQLSLWLDNLELAFGGQRMELAQWLPILEAGLGSLSVGVIPPVLDQVLIGAVDRSRNPDLKLLIVPGLNEGRFPAVPGSGRLLTEEDRDRLRDAGSELAELPALRLSQEQFYGYIACTRPRERLILSYAQSDADGTALNPSRFISEVRRIFPRLETRPAGLPETLGEVVHVGEFAAMGFDTAGAGGRGGNFPLRAHDPEESLDAGLARALYGNELKLGASSLEKFAGCPFRFFTEKGLGAKEREEFRVDVREQGSFQHEVLAEFHNEITALGKKWRDVKAKDARERIGRITGELSKTFRGGLFNANAQNRFTAESHALALQDFITQVIGWVDWNVFDPAAAELDFGMRGALPPWRLELGEGRAVSLVGRVDRVDLLRLPEGRTLYVVMDYKSGSKKPDRTLMHYGIQLQLPAYLLALAKVPEASALLGAARLEPVGGFLVPLLARSQSGGNRAKVIKDAEKARKEKHQHLGIFDLHWRSELDSAEKTSGQFKYRVTKEDRPYAKTFNALASDDFAVVLSHAEALIRESAERIYAGEIAVKPFKKGRETACDQCKFISICRFDPAAQRYNVLAPPAQASGSEKGVE